MGIQVTCASCQASFRVKDEFAGKRGKCPSCKAAIEVPSLRPSEADTLIVMPDETVATVTARIVEAPAPASPPPPSPEELGRQILAGFQGEIEPVHTSAAYRLGILLVTVVMVILPLVYIGLIAGVVYLVYLHAVHDTAILGAARGRGAVMVLLVYLAPIIIGGILVLFMVKPLFAPPAREPRRRSLDRGREPLLFAFVDRVCQAVRAPRPRRIDVDCEVNASASFRRGIWSMLGSDLVLTVGLPLVAGLNLRQFGGVLAHEFGHFGQGAGMRLTYLIRTISFWFTRVVYERDSWDQKLVEAAQGLDLRVGWVFHLARLFVWLTRKVLWVLMMIGHAVSGYMLRQMEFDADRCEARLAGSDTFESTARRLAVLNLATRGAHADLSEFYKEGRLGDNLPRLILANVDQIPAAAHAKLAEYLDTTETGALDTHPADKDRIASARAESAAGIFRLEQPATVLFSDFDGLARHASADFYREVFGPQFKPETMHSTEDLLARQGREQEADKALARYFQGSFTSLRPLCLPEATPAAPADAKVCAAGLKAARQTMLDARPAFDAAYQEYDKADTRTIEAEQAAVLLKANFTLRKDTFSVPVASTEQAAALRREALQKQGALVEQMAGMEQAAGQRIAAAMQLLCVPQVAARIDGAADMAAECRRAHAALVALNRQHAALLDLRNAHAAMAILAGNMEGHQGNESLFNSLRAQGERVCAHVRGLHDALRNAPYPFDHAKGAISIAQYALETVPPHDDLGAVYAAGGEMLDKLPPLYHRLAGRLVAAAEKVETALGLPPLPQPAERKEEAAGAAAEG